MLRGNAVSGGLNLVTGPTQGDQGHKPRRCLASAQDVAASAHRSPPMYPAHQRPDPGMTPGPYHPRKKSHAASRW